MLEFLVLLHLYVVQGAAHLMRGLEVTLACTLIQQRIAALGPKYPWWGPVPIPRWWMQTTCCTKMTRVGKDGLCLRSRDRLDSDALEIQICVWGQP